MKVKRLNEATNDQIRAAKARYDEAETEDDKLVVLGDFLMKDSSLSQAAWMRLKGFGFSFLDRWINAFKWEEAGIEDNDFIRLLNLDVVDKSDRPDHRDSVILDNIKNFTAAYNCYAGTNYFDGKILDTSNSGDAFLNPIFSKSLYDNSESDIKDIIKMWNRRANSVDNLTTIVHEFYEKTNFRKMSPSNWVVKSAAQIQHDLSSAGNYSDYNDLQLKNLLKDERNRKLAAAEIQKYENNNL